MSRPGLTTSLVAASTLALLVVTCFAVQAVALGRPGRIELLVVRTARALGRYHRDEARIVVDGRHVSAVCDQHWQRHRRFDEVRLDGIPLPLAQARHAGRLPAAELELAGCPRMLTGWLATQVNHGVVLELARAQVGGMHVYALRPAARRDGLRPLPLVSPGGLPVAVSLRGRGVRGLSELRFGTPGHAAPAADPASRDRHRPLSAQ